MPSQENLKKTVSFLSSKQNLSSIILLCESSGWSTGFVGSKLLKLISLRTNFKVTDQTNNEPEEAFEDQIELIELKFTALGKIIDYFHMQNSNSRLDRFDFEQLNFLREITVNSQQNILKVSQSLK